MTWLSTWVDPCGGSDRKNDGSCIVFFSFDKDLGLIVDAKKKEVIYRVMTIAYSVQSYHVSDTEVLGRILLMKYMW